MLCEAISNEDQHCRVCGAGTCVGALQQCPARRDCDPKWFAPAKNDKCPRAAQAERERLSAELEAREPGLAAKAAHYTFSVVRWMAAGSPLRDEAEIACIFAICRGCEFFRETDRPRCVRCGCSVNNLPAGLANLIAMATENCPLDPPKW